MFQSTSGSTLSPRVIKSDITLSLYHQAITKISKFPFHVTIHFNYTLLIVIVFGSDKLLSAALRSNAADYVLRRFIYFF